MVKGDCWADSFVFEANQKRKDGFVFPVEVSLGPITLAMRLS